MTASGGARVEAPGLRVCVLTWIEEHDAGNPLTAVPVEAVHRGAKSTQAFIENLKASREVIYRLKVCLVGCSCAGKTSLVKSFVSQKAQLVHLDRTIGIDHFPFRMERTINCRKVIYEITFWDFAGQDAYEVAHGLFFSARTLFFVFIDIETFTIAFFQASIMSNDETQKEQLMNEYSERTVMRWVQLILSRQPDAECVFIATKEDLLAENTVTAQLLKEALEAKLMELETTIHEMKTKMSQPQQTEEGEFEDDGHGVNDETKQRSQRFDLGRTGWLTQSSHRRKSNVRYVSFKSRDSVHAAIALVNELILQSERAFRMPDTYARALETITNIRTSAKTQAITPRIKQVFASVDSLPRALNLDPKLCYLILRTLHDLGDVLWYQDLGVEVFQGTVILDPLLLIDFIRQVINHEQTGQTLAHVDLKALPFWMGLSDQRQMQAMKQVLQEFHLVYSADDGRVMPWDSDMIVPAYWQTKTPASWLFLGDILRVNDRTKSCEDDVVRVDWEFHFECGLPASLFDHVVVASISPFIEFDAGPDWILYKIEDRTACRIMIGRDLKSLHRTIHVEAVVAKAATDNESEQLWDAFQQLCGAFLKVMREYPGLIVTSFAWDNKQHKFALRRLMRSTVPTSSSAWMPPTGTWEWFKETSASEVCQDD